MQTRIRKTRSFCGSPLLAVEWRYGLFSSWNKLGLWQDDDEERPQAQEELERLKERLSQ